MRLRILVCLPVLAVGSLRAETPASGLLAGVARADISPHVGIPQMNWGAQTHITATGIDPAGMRATALVLSDGRQKFAMVDVDALFVEPLKDVPARASALTGIPAEHIRLGATHTHAGPFLTQEKGPVGVDLSKYRPAFDTYWASVADKVVGIIVEANSHLVPAHIGGAKGTGTININRRMPPINGAPPAVGRNPDGPLDRELVVARIDDAQGRALAVIVNFQCHGTVLAWDNQSISPDWPGMMRRVVEDAFPTAKCLFFQGAAGNQGPVEGFVGDLEVAHRLGRILGHQAAALALEIETTRRAPAFEGYVESTAYIAKQPWRVQGPRDGTLRFTSTVVELPARKYSTQDINRMSENVQDAKVKVAAARKSGDPVVIHREEARLRRFQDLLNKYQAPPSAQPVAVRVQMLRVGEVVWVAMPGEPFAEIGMAIKRASPFKTTLFCGYSTGEGGEYMPVESAYPQYGYEVDRTPYGIGAAEKLVAAAKALYAKIQ